MATKNTFVFLWKYYLLLFEIQLWKQNTSAQSLFGGTLLPQKSSKR